MDREGTDVYGKETCMEKEIVSFCRNKRKMGWEVKGMSDKLMTFVLAGAVFMALLKDLIEYIKK